MTTKQRILEAAKQRFARDGIEGLSMRNLAHDVGLTPMALYRHYADKDALIDALSADALEEWRQRVAAISAADPLPWLDSLFETFLDFALETPRRFEAAFILHARGASRYPDDFAAGRSQPVNMQLAHIEEAQQRGIFDHTPPIEIAMTLAALGQGLISLYRAGRFAGSEKDFRTLCHSMVRRSMASFQTRRTTA